MKFRTVVRVVLPFAVAATLCFRGTAQATGDVPVQGAPTIGASTNLDSNSNDLTSLYGTPVVEIIARVNDQVITNDDLTRAQTQLAQEARQNNWTIDQINSSQKTLLRDLIDQQLLLSKGKQLGITGDTELIKRLDEVRKENHLDSLDDLEKAVEQQGISWEDFKANIRNSVITQQVVRDEVGSKLQLSQAEIQKYYQDHLNSFTRQESVRLNEILIPTSENPTSAELASADAKAKEVEAKLKAGASFTELAKQYSSGPTAQQGGNLGEFHRGALAKVLEDQTFDLPIGGYTAPIRTRQGYILLQVTAHVPGGTEPLQKVEPQIEQALYMQKIEPAVRQYLTRLRDEAYIDIRPGYTDSGASPNESKPTFAAYTPPQPKKKKKKIKSREVRYGRGTVRKKGAATQVASAPALGTASPSVQASSAGHGKSARAKRNAPKPVKFRFGRAPATPVSAEQVATSVGPTEPASAVNSGSAPVETAPASDVQPLGPDLEHAPLITQPKEGKWRFSDEAHNKAARRANKKHKTSAKVKSVKHDNAKPTNLSPTEAENAKVQDAALGLNGSTATAKKKQKKVTVRNGEKIRLSDEKKKEEQDKGKGTSMSPASSSGSSGTTSSSVPASSSSTEQPQ
ncbi:MAG TPA: peptidylprolyl isomerase [Acidobacteriaceae bacterium]|nr:peptidylprolyl isomerase [Terriglobia bacterium]HVC91127.1 peptidylprolyl isomerase [Acidobacteriaceae bacterium]